jgi:hypothetical protein
VINGNKSKFPDMVKAIQRRKSPCDLRNFAECLFTINCLLLRCSPFAFYFLKSLYARLES